MTATHCICYDPTNIDPSQDPIHSGAYCKSIDKNQIGSNNKITVYGGDMDKQILLSDIRYKFKIYKALIYEPPSKIDVDIGILKTKKPLFDNNRLLKLSSDTSINLNLNKHSILPICLASKNLNLVDKSIHGVGWGMAYDEKINPYYYSSCMTNEMGHKDWKFQHCNMEKIEKNNWSCEKKTYPPVVTTYQHECNELFYKARIMFYKTDRAQIKFLDKVNKIIVSHEDDPAKKTICYRETLFWDKGWCEVHQIDSKTNPNAWGFCSSSCNPEFLKVLIGESLSMIH